MKPERDVAAGSRRAAATASERGARRFGLPWLATALALFAALAYGPAMNLPFMGDDYVFLDRTRDERFFDLWSFQNTDFGWYRPWSRELHFWLLQKVAGLDPVAFRTFGVALWIIGLCLYAAVVRRLATERTAALATLGVAGLALWGTPILWISGSQDLWMLCFSMASVLLFVTGRAGWALVPFAGALLSKETAAVLPALLFGYAILLERRRPAEALRRTALFWSVAFAWWLIHPTLHARLLAAPQPTSELLRRTPSLLILPKAVLSLLNLDALPSPQEIGWVDVLRVVASALILAAGVATVLREPDAASRPRAPAGRATLVRFGFFWAAVGWLPLFHFSVAWHAYYGCLGALGAWFALARWLEERPRIAVVGIACLAILRGAQASTLSWDWGNEWYQRRAGTMLSVIRDGLLRQHPTLPRHSRVFLGHIPNNVGLIAGRSPALRVWYRDPTIEAGFYSSYRPRSASTPPGEDFFFRFDSVSGMVEVRAGPENMNEGPRTNPDWVDDHEKLAMLFLRSGDPARAAVEFEKLSLLPGRPEAAGYAAVCREAAGDTARADSLIAVAGSRMRLSPPELRRWRSELRASFPAPSPDPSSAPAP
jgi:hypothetical protein